MNTNKQQQTEKDLKDVRTAVHNVATVIIFSKHILGTFAMFGADNYVDENSNQMKEGKYLLYSEMMKKMHENQEEFKSNLQVLREIFQSKYFCAMDRDCTFEDIQEAYKREIKKAYVEAIAFLKECEDEEGRGHSIKHIVDKYNDMLRKCCSSMDTIERITKRD